MSALSSLRQRGGRGVGEGGRTLKGHKSPPIQFVSIEAVFQENFWSYCGRINILKYCGRINILKCPNQHCKAHNDTTKFNNNISWKSRGFKLNGKNNKDLFEMSSKSLLCSRIESHLCSGLRSNRPPWLHHHRLEFFNILGYFENCWS